MRMFGYFILVILDVYALFLGLYLHKSILFSCGVLRAVTSPLRRGLTAAPAPPHA